MKILDPCHIARVIYKQVISEDKTDEENIERLTTYLKHRQYEIISSAICEMRKASKAMEDNILEQLNKLD